MIIETFFCAFTGIDLTNQIVCPSCDRMDCAVPAEFFTESNNA